MDRPIRPRHPLGDRWIAEVDGLVERLRGREVGRLRVEDLVRRSGIELEVKPLRSSLLGLTLDAGRVLLNSELTGARANFTLAHELAHVYRRRGYFAGLRETEEEWFADWFAHEMLLPRVWLWRDWSAQGIAGLHVDRVTVALQLAVVGKAPEIMRAGTQVLCRSCGSRYSQPGCRCRRYRNSSSDALQALPEVPDLWERRSHWDQLCLLCDARKQPVDAQYRSPGAVSSEPQSLLQRAW